MRDRLSATAVLVSLALIGAGWTWALGWRRSYPISLADPADSLWNHIDPLVWIGIALAGVALVIVAAGRANPVVSLAATIGFALAYSSPSFLRFVAGSDTAGVIALTEGWLATGSMDVGLHRYLQWPVTFVALGAISTAAGLPVETAAHLAFFMIVVWIAVALFACFGGDSRAAVGVALFLIVATPFLNWQLSPQTLAFAMFVTLVALGKHRSVRVVILSVGILAVLALTHPFVGFWFLGYALVMAALQWWRQSILGRPADDGWTLSPVLVTAVLLATVAYVATSLVRDVAAAVQHIGAALETGGSILTASGVGTVGTGDPASPIYRLTVVAAALSVVLAALVTAGGLALAARQRVGRATDVALIATGAVHFATGVVAPVLGGRGLQVLALGLPWGVRTLLDGRRAIRLAAKAAIVTSILCSTALVAAGTRRDTRYMTPDLVAAGSAATSRMTTAGMRVFGPGVAMGYAALKAPVRVDVLNPRATTAAELFDPRQRPSLVLSSVELAIELERVPGLERPSDYLDYLARFYAPVETVGGATVWVLR